MPERIYPCQNSLRLPSFKILPEPQKKLKCVIQKFRWSHKHEKIPNRLSNNTCERKRESLHVPSRLPTTKGKETATFTHLGADLGRVEFRSSSLQVASQPKRKEKWKKVEMN